jgi:hypothetical protein
VLRNDPCLANWKETFANQEFEDQPEFKDWLLCQMRGMMSMGITVDEREWNLAVGPHQIVKIFTHIWQNGKCIRTEARDGPNKAT